MSARDFDDQANVVSKAEKVAWLQAGLLVVAGICMGWLWWSSWPDAAALKRNAAVLEPWPIWMMPAALGGLWLLKLRGPKEPLEDERDRAINGQARTNGFAALAVMVVLLCVAVRTEGLLREHLTPDWLTLTLLSMLALALLLDAVYRLLCYRRG